MSTSPKKVEDLCSSARRALNKGRYDEAGRLYEKALALDDNRTDVHYGLGTVAFLRKELDDAAKHFKRATELDPLRAGAFINLGAIYNKLDRHQDAIDSLRKGIKLDPQRAEGYYNLGVVYRKTAQLELAIQAYREAAHLNPRMAEAFFNLGNTYADLERFSEAINNYQEALKVRPDFDKAKRALRKAKKGLEELAKRLSLAHVPEEPKKTASPAKPTTASAEAMSRVVDPTSDGKELAAMHDDTSLASELLGQFIKLLEGDFQSALHTLTRSIMHSEVPGPAVDGQINAFQEKLREARDIRDRLHKVIDDLDSDMEKLEHRPH